MKTNSNVRWMRLLATAALGCLVFGSASPGAAAEELRVAWSDPAKPGTVVIDLLHGQITVEGYEGREVMVDATGDGLERMERDTKAKGKRAGLRKIGGTGGGLNLEEQGNVLRVTVPMPSNARIAMRVPANTSLKLSCINCDDMVINNVNGDLELKNINGGIRAKNAGGAVVAHSLNDDVEVQLRGTDGSQGDVVLFHEWRYRRHASRHHESGLPDRHPQR
ncbi:MAG: hypothetical protein U5J83_14190 [Bryobacterales bacterium]|nr:hypothetical protein [Bryobacterales bacterium]